MAFIDLQLSPSKSYRFDQALLKMRRPRTFPRDISATPWTFREGNLLGLEETLRRCAVPPQSGQWGEPSQSALG